MFEKIYGGFWLLAGLVALAVSVVIALDMSGMTDRASWKSYPGTVKNEARIGTRGNSVAVTWKDETGPREGNVPSDTSSLAWAEPLVDKPVEVLVYRPRIGSELVCVAKVLDPCRKDHTKWVVPISLAVMALAGFWYGSRVLKNA